MIPDILIAAVLSFIFAVFGLPFWISRSRQHGLVISDVQKVPARKIPYLTGLIVIFSAVIGILSFIFSQTFLSANGDSTAVLLSAVAAILIALIIGVVDDLLGEKIGLRQYQKVFLTFFASLPLVVVNAGHNVMNIPFFGQVALGNIYPFVIVPIGVMGASNGFNILAGVNGLEAGMGILIFGTLGYLTWMTGSHASVIAFCMLAALLPFFWFNKFPARILPGNGLTYAVGAAIAAVAIIGDMERAALLLFIPYFIEGLLKLRGGFQKESLARPLSDGSLANKYPRWYSLNHMAISFLRKLKGKAREWEVALLLFGFELIFVIATLVLYLR